jgi:hypothetical protein
MAFLRQFGTGLDASKRVRLVGCGVRQAAARTARVVLLIPFLNQFALCQLRLAVC